MAGVFKNLDASDIRLTPFRTHKKWNNAICLVDYFPQVQSNPINIGLLPNEDTALYATDVVNSKLLRLDQNDKYTILNNVVVSNLINSKYNQDLSRSYITAYSTASNKAVVGLYANDLSLNINGEYTSSDITYPKDVSYSVTESNSYTFIAGDGDVRGVTGKEFNPATGAFIGGEFTITNMTAAATGSITGSAVAVQAEGKLHNDTILAIYSTGSIGTKAVMFTGSYATPLIAAHGVLLNNSSTPSQVKTTIYNQTQNKYFVLEEEGTLYKLTPDNTVSGGYFESNIIAQGVADILQDKSNFVSGSTDYQASKIHVVYKSGQVGLDLISTGTETSFDVIVDARQYVALKPIVKAVIQQNETPAQIGLFAGSVDSLVESVFVSINPDTAKISEPYHYGSTKGDLKIGVANGNTFIGFNSIYNDRFFEFPTSQPNFTLYKADYNPTPSHPSYNPLDTHFDEGNPTFDRYEPKTHNGKFQRIVHKSLNHLFYESFYDNTKATFGSGNINNQVRFIEDQAYVLNLPQSKFGEAIQQKSINVQARLTISGSSTQVTIVDDLNSNMYVSGGLISPIDATVYVSESVSKQTVGEWPTQDLYKYNTKGPTNTTSAFNKGNWQMETQYSNITFTTIAGSQLPIPSPIDLLGVVPVFSSTDKSKIEIKPSIVQDYRQSYNFENSDFAISFMIRPTNTSSHPSGSIIIAKQGKTKEYGVDINGNILQYTETEKAPYRLSMNSSYDILFERDALFESSVVSGSLSQNELSHVVVMKTGSNIQIYIDSQLIHTAADIQNIPGCSNKANINIGNLESLDRGFDGMIDNIKMYSSALTQPDINLLYHTLGQGDTVLGNAFYNHGMLTLTSNMSRYLDIENVTARGTHTIYEKEVSCTIGAGEFNRSSNPTLHEYNPVSNQFEFKSFTTGSDFKPYVTAVGLYDDYGRMVAVAKLGSPIQLPSNVDSTIVVRYDS